MEFFFIFGLLVVLVVFIGISLQKEIDYGQIKLANEEDYARKTFPLPHVQSRFNGITQDESCADRVCLGANA